MAMTPVGEHFGLGDARDEVQAVAKEARSAFWHLEFVLAYYERREVPDPARVRLLKAARDAMSDAMRAAQDAGMSFGMAADMPTVYAAPATDTAQSVESEQVFRECVNPAAVDLAHNYQERMRRAQEADTARRWGDAPDAA